MHTETAPVLLNTAQMATFAARGFIRLDAVVPPHINAQFLADVAPPQTSAAPSTQRITKHYARIMRDSTIPLVNPGTPLKTAYPPASAIAQMLRLPYIRGAINSLVGTDAVVDHHFLHITFPPAYHRGARHAQTSQPTHQDSTIDPRQAFDVQLFYFPQAVTAAMGGTRFVPGSHLRIVSEAALARYQNIRGQQHVVCPAGTVLFFHMGLWHGGGLNQSEDLRYLFKIRLCPTARQCRLWDTTDQPLSTGARPIFWTDGATQADHLFSILTHPEPWYEADTSRLEFINRIKFWRYLSGDETFDADYWLTRIENEFK